ncbi:molybdopterin molybdotransferase MoeA [Thermaurantiacus sp.]
MPADLLPLEEAQSRLLSSCPVLDAETVPLGAASGRVLAGDVTALLTQPPADVSAMDGWAIRHADLPGPFRIVGEAAAGSPFAGRVAAGEAVRIFTGAWLPTGADTVALQEEMTAAAGEVRLSGEGPPHVRAHVRRAGQDFRAGEWVARAGQRLSPATIGLLAAAGHGEVRVRRRPRVALVATGSELVAPGTTPAAGQIPSSNGVMLRAMLEAEGAEVRDHGILPDALAPLMAGLRQAAADADLLVTIGGASVGDHDLVRPALVELGGTLDFWRIAVRPGKPLMAGRLSGAMVLGLPGNPVSAFVCALLFALPLVRAMQGRADALPLSEEAITDVALPANGPRRDFQRARLFLGTDGRWRVVPAPVQDSSMLSVLSGSNALLVRPERAHAVPAGSPVPVLRL